MNILCVLCHIRLFVYLFRAVKIEIWSFWLFVLVISNINSVSQKSLSASISTQYKWAYWWWVLTILCVIIFGVICVCFFIGSSFIKKNGGWKHANTLWMCFTSQIMYARAVWLEHGKEVEGTAPDNWIDAEKKIIRWPKKGEKGSFPQSALPSGWMDDIHLGEA